MSKTRYEADDYASIAQIVKQNEEERLKNLMGKPIEETKSLVLDSSDITWTAVSGTGYQFPIDCG